MYTFKDKVVIVTGGANGIGRCIAGEFRSQGAYRIFENKLDDVIKVAIVNEINYENIE